MKFQVYCSDLHPPGFRKFSNFRLLPLFRLTFSFLTPKGKAGPSLRPLGWARTGVADEFTVTMPGTTSRRPVNLKWPGGPLLCISILAFCSAAPSCPLGPRIRPRLSELLRFGAGIPVGMISFFLFLSLSLFLSFSLLIYLLFPYRRSACSSDMLTSTPYAVFASQQIRTVPFSEYPLFRSKRSRDTWNLPFLWPSKAICTPV